MAWNKPPGNGSLTVGSIEKGGVIFKNELNLLNLKYF
jgi:hypothetical protein